MSKFRVKKNEEFPQLRKQAEEELKQRKRKSSPTELEHELSVHEIELQMQNLELLETQEKLNATLTEYAELFELSPVGYYILDKNGTIEKVNIRAAVQLGIDKEHLLNKPFSMFLHTALDQDNFYRHRNKALEEGTLERMECEVKMKDGDIFAALIKSKVIKDEKGQFKHLLSMMTDISHLKEHEHQIELQLIRSEELSTMKSRFIGIASHEFRTPLTSIMSSTILIEKYTSLGDTEKIKKNLTRIKLSIKSLINILDKFLSIEKLESGKIEIHRINFDLTELCENLIDEVTALKKKGQIIHYTHTGNKEINEDRDILQQIVINLLSNACKYSPEETSINFLTSVIDHQIKITVEDQGIGIPEAEQTHIFSRFFRAPNTGNIQGTGLGLNIVKRYVELLNGTISFISKLNQGTTFTVEFPQIR